MNDEQRQAIAEAFDEADSFGGPDLGYKEDVLKWIERVVEPILCDALRRRAESAEAALRAVRELHLATSDEHPDGPWCFTCGFEHPCATALAAARHVAAVSPEETK